MTRSLRAAVLASGGGSNLQALLDHSGAVPPATGGSAAPRPGPWRVALVLSDRSGAGALARAERHGIPSEVVPAGADRDPAEVADRMLEALARSEIDLILLAGYLKLVPAGVVARYGGRMLNIHPALLPSFGGKGMYGIHVHRAVLESGARISGATVHLVNDVYDRGRILAQWPVPVHEADTPETLAARVLEVEHVLYPAVVDHLAGAVLDGREPAALDPPGLSFHLSQSPVPAIGDLQRT